MARLNLDSQVEMLNWPQNIHMILELRREVRAKPRHTNHHWVFEATESDEISRLRVEIQERVG